MRVSREERNPSRRRQEEMFNLASGCTASWKATAVAWVRKEMPNLHGDAGAELGISS